jgi:hypothetical protein
MYLPDSQRETSGEKVEDPSHGEHCPVEDAGKAGEMGDGMWDEQHYDHRDQLEKGDECLLERECSA